MVTEVSAYAMGRPWLPGRSYGLEVRCDMPAGYGQARPVRSQCLDVSGVPWTRQASLSMCLPMHGAGKATQGAPRASMCLACPVRLQGDRGVSTYDYGYGRPSRALTGPRCATH